MEYVKLSQILYSADQKLAIKLYTEGLVVLSVANREIPENIIINYYQMFIKSIEKAKKTINDLRKELKNESRKNEISSKPCENNYDNLLKERNGEIGENKKPSKSSLKIVFINDLVSALKLEFDVIIDTILLFKTSHSQHLLRIIGNLYGLLYLITHKTLYYNKSVNFYEQCLRKAVRESNKLLQLSVIFSYTKMYGVKDVFYNDLQNLFSELRISLLKSKTNEQKLIMDEVFYWLSKFQGKKVTTFNECIMCNEKSKKGAVVRLGDETL